MTKGNLLRSQKGFTLIEMMLVVAIIGVLSTLAKFGYENYQETARQAEAKLTLPAIAASEDMFRSEYGGYITDIAAMKFIRKGSNFWYAVGWNTAAQGNVLCPAVVNGVYGTTAYTVDGFQFDGITGGCHFLADNPRTVLSQTNCAAGATRTALATNSTAPAALVRAATFKVAVSGLISAGKVCDTWTIDHDGNIVQVTRGK